MQKLLSTVGILMLATTAIAQNFAVASFANNGNTIGGTTGNVWRAGTNRVQCLYDSSNFVNQGIGQPITISNLDYFAGATTAGGITYPSVDIYVGLAAVDHAAPSTTFANNRSASFPTTPNFSGPVTTVAATAGQFFANIPLAVPFNYIPDSGVDLLVEIVINTAPTPLTGTTIDAGFNVATHKVNSVRSVGSTVALTGSLSAFCPTVRFTYADVPGAAKNQRYGTGCYTKARSFYELFTGAGSNDLSGKTVLMSPNTGGGYTVTTLPTATVVPGVGVGLGLGDDQMSAALTLPWSFDYPGGTTTTIYVNSNGALHLNGAGTAQIGGSAAALLNATVHTLAAALQDTLPDGAANINNVFHGVNPTNANEYLITWNNVPNFGATVPTPSTFQIALIDSGANDSVEFRFQTLVNDSSSNTANCVVGFSLGGGAINPGSSDLTAGPIVTAADQQPLTLAAAARPVVGTTVAYNTSSIPFGTPTAPGISFLLINFGGVDAGVDLTPFGAPGCTQYIDLTGASTNLMIGGPTNSVNVTIPNNTGLAGLPLDFQSWALDSGANALGVVNSNGVASTVGTL